jgi:hypothetical protein
MMPYTREFFILHYQLSLFLTALTAFSLGFFILMKNARHVMNRTFAVFMPAPSYTFRTPWSAFASPGASFGRTPSAWCSC